MRPAAFEWFCQVGEKVAVCGERDVERVGMCGRLELRQLANEIDNAIAQQRFASREPNFCDAHADQHARHAQVILEGQVAVERAFVTRPAVDTFVVAAVGDGDSQVSDGAAEFVGEGHGAGGFDCFRHIIGRAPEGGFPSASRAPSRSPPPRSEP